MDHSLESYLGRQPTEILELLLREEESLQEEVALLIAVILKTREKE